MAKVLPIHEPFIKRKIDVYIKTSINSFYFNLLINRDINKLIKNIYTHTHTQTQTHTRIYTHTHQPHTIWYHYRKVYPKNNNIYKL